MLSAAREGGGRASLKRRPWSFYISRLTPQSHDWVALAFETWRSSRGTPILAYRAETPARRLWVAVPIM
jgi:transposase